MVTGPTTALLRDGTPESVYNDRGQFPDRHRQRASLPPDRRVVPRSCRLSGSTANHSHALSPTLSRAAARNEKPLRITGFFVLSGRCECRAIRPVFDITQADMDAPRCVMTTESRRSAVGTRLLDIGWFAVVVHHRVRHVREVLCLRELPDAVVRDVRAAVGKRPTVEK